MDRRHFIKGSAAGVALIASAPVRALEGPRQLRIGYQKNGVLLVAKQQKLFE